MKYLSLLLLFLIVLCSCSTEERRDRAQHQEAWQQAKDKIKVLSTIAMIDDLVKEIGKDQVETLVLVKGELDPHSYQLVKGDDEKLASADLIFYNGLGLEHGPSLQYYLKNSSKAIALGEQVMEQYPREILEYQGRFDPHIWMDISIWEKTIPFIVNALSKRDPAHAQEFHHRGAQLAAKMRAKHMEIKLQLANIPENKRYLVTSHDAFNYFAKSYLATEEEQENHSWQKRFAAPEGLAPDSQLNPADIQAIIVHLKQHEINVLFPESNISKDSIRKIVNAGKEKGLNLHIANASLYGDAMGPPHSEGDSYLKMMSHNASVIESNLRRYSFPLESQHKPQLE